MIMGNNNRREKKTKQNMVTLQTHGFNQTSKDGLLMFLSQGLHHQLVKSVHL